MQIAVLGALRNLSYGRANEENKLQIAGEHGLPEIMLALQMSRVPEVSVYMCMCMCVYIILCVCVCVMCAYVCVICVYVCVYVCVICVCVSV